MFDNKVLNSNQVHIIPMLGFLKSRNVYLGGGTALAMQVGHRTSVDLDFFSEQNQPMQLIVSELQKAIKNLVITRIEEHTLFAKAGDTDISLFYYPYKLLNPFVEHKSLYLASIEDIVAMKIAAIIQRGTRRDFVDIYYLLQDFSLKQMLELTRNKFPGYQDSMALRALIYFEDADSEDIARGIQVFDKDYSWEKAKKKILSEVKKYQRSLL